MASDEQEDCGFPEEWFQNKAELERFDFLCPICYNVIRQATVTSCHHAFCKGCLIRCEENSHGADLCPKCRTQYTRMGGAHIDRQISRLMVHCPLHCEWTGELGQLEGHRRVCPVRQAACACCDTTMRADQLDEHIKVCLERKTACTYCAALVKVHDLDQHVGSHCPKIELVCDECKVFVERGQLSHHVRSVCPIKCPTCALSLTRDTFRHHELNACLISCPNRCKDDVPFLTRVQLPSHLSKACPLAIVPCPYHRLGCTTKLKGAEVAHHVQSMAFHHTSLLEGNESKTSSHDLALHQHLSVLMALLPEDILIRSVKNRNIQAVETLIQLGYDVNGRDAARKDTALMWAAYQNDVDMVILLYSAQAQLELTNALGNTAFLEAAGQGARDTALLLVTLGANVDAVNRRGETWQTLLMNNAPLRTELEHLTATKTL